MLNQHVGQQQREWLAAEQFARAPHRMAEPERLLLAREAGRARHRQILIEKIEDLVLLPLEQRHFELELAVEMILDDRFVAAGDKNEMLDTGLAGVVKDILGQRRSGRVDHLLWQWRWGRDEPGAKGGARANC